MSSAQEYNDLLDLIKFKEYRRYGNDLYAKYCFDDGYEWKFEYNICELVWGFCKNPCFANRLVKLLENSIPDMNICLKVLAKGNVNINNTKMYNRWETAIDAIELNESQKPMIIYSTENSHVWSNKRIFCNDVDGELWHGVLMTKDALDNLDYISIELSATNYNNQKWKTEYRWHSSDVVNQCREFDYLQKDLLLFTPFKHPLILLHSGLDVNVSFNFTDGRLPKESQIKMVYGVCNNTLRNWIEHPTCTFTTELAHGRKLIVDTSQSCVDEVSINKK